MFKLSMKNRRKLVKASKQPYAVSLGAAVGMFWNFIPSLGVGPVLSMVTAKLLKASGITAVAANLATGVFIPLFYTLNYMTGRILFGYRPTSADVQSELGASLEQSLNNAGTIVEEPGRFFSLYKLQSVSESFIYGSLVNAILAAILVYIIMYLVLANIKTKGKKEKKVS